MHPFDNAIQLKQVGENRYAGATSPAYGNMVGPYGGITCATLLNAVLQHPERIGEPVALTVNFVSPIAEGAFEIEAKPVRTNRSTQHWGVQMTSGGDVSTTASVVFARRRETWSAPEATAPVGLPQPETLPSQNLTPLPPWVQRYDMRFACGDLSAEFDESEQADSKTRLWIRDDPPRILDFPGLAAICDCFYPRILIRRRRLVPCSTISLSTYFHADTEGLTDQGDGYLLGAARGQNFRNGYCDQQAGIWSDAGELLASSNQMIYYRE
jgi:acyl-CoA thioesterase